MSKIENVERHRLSDLAACAHFVAVIVRCPGGRPIVDGYICPHCGADPSHGDCEGVIGFKKDAA